MKTVSTDVMSNKNYTEVKSEKSEKYGKQSIEDFESESSECSNSSFSLAEETVAARIAKFNRKFED